MMVPRCEFGLCAVDGFLYAFGGWVGEDIGGSIEMYDPGLNEWRMQGKMQVYIFPPIKFVSSMASKPINIRWIKTGSQPHSKIMY